MKEAKADDVKRAALQQHYALLKIQIKAKEAVKARKERARASECPEPAFPREEESSSTPSTASGYRGASSRRPPPLEDRPEAMAPPVFSEEQTRPPVSSDASSGKRAAGVVQGVGGVRSAMKPPPL